MIPEEVLFGSLVPGGEFYSNRAAGRTCVKLDQPYRALFGEGRDLNAFVSGGESGLPTLAHFDSGETVRVAVSREESAETVPYPFLRQFRQRFACSF